MCIEVSWGAPIPAVVNAKYRVPKRFQDDVVARVAMKHGLLASAIEGRSRTARVVAARHEVIWVCQVEHPELSQSELARMFDMDHSSIQHALKMHLKRNPDLERHKPPIKALQSQPSEQREKQL